MRIDETEYEVTAPVRDVLERALPLLVRLGDFIGNGEIDPGRPGSLGERCDVIGDIRRLIAQRVCVSCGQPIEYVPEAGTWIDAGTVPSASIVYCHDQDETHDGIRHAPRTSADHALDAIAFMLADPEWDSGMLEDIAELVTQTGRTMEPVYRWVARFVPQAWVRDNAVDVDPEGDTEWDATEAFNALPAEYAQQLVNELHDDDDAEVLDVDDALQSDANAPAWVREWKGPFSLYVRPTTATWDRH